MNSKNKISLWRVTPDDYGPSIYQLHLLEQYKLFVQTAERISNSRTSANNYLLTVNAFLISLYGLASSRTADVTWIIIVPIAGILICISWIVIIRSYRQLNTAKFKVIHELEQRLPAALFDREWELLDRGEGKAYKPFTRIEPYIPIIFAVLYVILAVVAFMK